MHKEQTIELLRQCNAGVKTAVNSIEAVLPRARDDGFTALLDHYLEKHEALGDQIHTALSKAGGHTRAPSAMARMMAGGKIGMKYAMHPNDATIADLMSDGCAMGVRKLCHVRNQCAGASGEARLLATRLIETENEMMSRMTPFL